MFVLLISQPLRYHIIDVDLFTVWVWVECIGVLSQMQRYFSHICDCTDVQADWRSCTYGRAPNAIDNLQGYLTYPSYTDKGPPFLYGEPTHRPISSPFTTRLGIRRTYFRLKHPASSPGGGAFYRIVRGFLRQFASDVICNDCHQRTLTLPVSLYSPIWNLHVHVFFCKDQSLLNFSCFQILISNSPKYFYSAFYS